MKRSRRILSLVLALIMLCSTMGIMSFAAVGDSISAWCPNCNYQRTFTYLFYNESLNRIIECPNHNGTHDAEEIYCGHFYQCSAYPNDKSHRIFILTDIKYACLN